MSSGATNASLAAQPGHLYVVATPIGNLADLTERARAILGSVDTVACEDTRTTGALLGRLGIRRELVAYHEHNETEAAERLAESVASGRSVALATDAGTPGLSDPGSALVRACRRRGLPVVPVPGPVAFAAVLCASGLPTNGFLFAGFLAPKTSARLAFLEKHRDFGYTIALYESCHRITKAVDDIVSALGPDRVVCVAKEVTKVHETFWVGPAGEVRGRLASASLKGEFTLLIAPSGLPSSAPRTMRVAVVDIGSNSIKLLVASRSPDGRLVEIRSRTLEVRIRPGHRRGQAPAWRRRDGAGRRRSREPARPRPGVWARTRIVAVATSAVRDASNGPEFRERVRAATGAELRILTGVEEANLIGRGLTTDPALAGLADFHVYRPGRRQPRVPRLPGPGGRARRQPAPGLRAPDGEVRRPARRAVRRGERAGHRPARGRRPPRVRPSPCRCRPATRWWAPAGR